MPVLKVQGLNVFYGNIHALHDIDFNVNEGEIVTLIGANGAGKNDDAAQYLRPYSTAFGKY